MKINLYNSECLEQMDRLIKDGIKVDAIITDPPYGTVNCSWDSIIPFDDMWIRLNQLINPNGAIVLFGTQPYVTKLISSNITMFKYDWIWEKENGTNFPSVNYQPFRVHEHIIVFGDFHTTYSKNAIKNYNPQFAKGNSYVRDHSKGIPIEERKVGTIDPNSSAHNRTHITKNNGKRYPRSILKINREQSKNRVHPTQKPIKLMEYLIKTYTNKNETVLDFTMGSGTTGVACANTNRNFIGIEIDENYFNVAKDRIENAKNNKKVEESNKSKLNKFFN